MCGCGCVPGSTAHKTTSSGGGKFAEGGKKKRASGGLSTPAKPGKPAPSRLLKNAEFG